MDDFKEKADRALAALRLLRQSGEIGIELYCKMVIKLCLEYVKADRADEVVLLLRGLPSEYFSEVLPEQMDEDPEFCEISYEVACAIVDNKGLDQGSAEINMKPGLA